MTLSTSPVSSGLVRIELGYVFLQAWPPESLVEQFDFAATNFAHFHIKIIRAQWITHLII